MGVMQGNIKQVVGITQRILSIGSYIILSDDDTLVGAEIIGVQQKALTQIRRDDAHRAGYLTRKALLATLSQPNTAEVVILQIKPSQNFICGLTL